MKKIRIENGEVRNGLEYGELMEEVQNQVISEFIDFEIAGMDEDNPLYFVVEEMERMKTPWFLAATLFDEHRDYFVELIEINEYLFSETGLVLPILHYTATGQHTFSYGKIEYKCTIENS